MPRRGEHLEILPADEPVDAEPEPSLQERFGPGYTDEGIGDIKPDPAPNRERPVPTKKNGEVTARIKKQVAETVDEFFDVLIDVWEMKDPICGGKMSEKGEKVKASIVKIICRRPHWAAAMVGVGDSADIFALGWALLPVATTVYGHHVAHTITDEQTPMEVGGVDLAAFRAPRIA